MEPIDPKAMALLSDALQLGSVFQGPSKWLASEEALWEIEALQAYANAVATHDMRMERPVYATAAFDLAANAE